MYDTGTRVRAKNIWGEEFGRISRTSQTYQVQGRKGIVGVVAAGETGSFSKAKAANSCHLHYWYIILFSIALGTNCSTGTPGVDNKMQCDLLSKEFYFQHISLNDVLREKSDDRTYLHAKFVKDCLEEEVKVPTQLAICLLESKIDKGIKGEVNQSFLASNSLALQ